MYTYDDDDWGEAEEDNSQSQWAADEWEASDQAEQHAPIRTNMNLKIKRKKPHQKAMSTMMLAGYSLSITSNSKKNNEEILITNGKDMPKGRNVLLKHYKGKK
jgi:hypothetical protein